MTGRHQVECVTSALTTPMVDFTTETSVLACCFLVYCSHGCEVLLINGAGGHVKPATKEKLQSRRSATFFVLPETQVCAQTKHFTAPHTTKIDTLEKAMRGMVACSMPGPAQESFAEWTCSCSLFCATFKVPRTTQPIIKHSYTSRSHDCYDSLVP